MSKIELGFSKDENFNDLTQIIIGKVSIVLNEDEIKELFDLLTNSLGYEVRERW